MANAKTDKQTARIEQELTDLLHRSTKQLRAQWRELFRRKPPSSFARDLLRRSIAYRIQEQAYGGLAPEIQREIEQLVKQLKKNPIPKIEQTRRIMPGCVLARDWKGKSYRVIVENSCFSYEGEKYSTLSEIARKITGTRWNGPRFFGLRKSDETHQSSALLKLKPHRGAR